MFDYFQCIKDLCVATNCLESCNHQFFVSNNKAIIAYTTPDECLEVHKTFNFDEKYSLEQNLSMIALWMLEKAEAIEKNQFMKNKIDIVEKMKTVKLLCERYTLH